MRDLVAVVSGNDASSVVLLQIAPPPPPTPLAALARSAWGMACITGSKKKVKQTSNRSLWAIDL